MPSVIRKVITFAVLLACALVGYLRWSEIRTDAADPCQTPSFAAIVTANVGNTPRSVAAGDFSGDGKPDLVTANYFGDNVSLLLGDGAGNFAITGTVTTGQRPRAVALADFNNDSKLDLVVSRDFSSTVSLLLGTGTGTFSAPVDFPVGPNPSMNPLSLVTADFNNDGKRDIATGNDGSSTVSILLGNGTGGFAPATSVSGIRPASLAVADFNGDSKPDLAASNISNGMVTIILGDGNGGFGTATHFNGGSLLQGIAATDFNGDNAVDIAVTNFSDCCTPAFVAVLLGDGAGSFGANTKFPVPAGPLAIAVGDFNGDAKKDVATANVQQTSSNVSVLLGNGAGALGAATNFSIGAAPNFVITGDVNLDGAVDLIATNPPNATALLNACGGAPTPTPTPTPTPSPTPTPTPTPAPGDVVISQIYGGGGNPGSTFQNNFVELFNRSNTAFNISGWPIHFGSATGPFNVSVSFVSSQGVFISPGKYLLIQLGPNSTNGAPLPTPDFVIPSGGPFPPINLSPSGKLAFTRPSTVLPPVPCPLPNSNVVDLVGYGATANCFEGSGPTATLSNTTAALRQADGCTDTDNNGSDFVVGVPNPRNRSAPARFCSSAAPVVQFIQSTFNVTEESASIGLMVTRTGNTSGASTVSYTTSDSSGANNCNVISGHASARCDYIATVGTLNFAAGETFKLINVPLVGDAYAEGAEEFSVSLGSTTNATLGSPASTTVHINDDDTTNGANPIDQTAFFVRQHYVDFLNREPDNAGLSFWMGEINNCAPKPQCTEIKRINVSAAFFLSIEFQETGYLAYRMHKAAYGDTTSPNVAVTVPIIRLQEFLPDALRLGEGVRVGIPGWEAVLESNKTAYALEFVQRQRFLTDYPMTMSPVDFVDTLNLKAGGVLSPAERVLLIAELVAATDITQGRASVLRKVAEDADLREREKNRAFVLMQYYGYLRRNPDDPQDADFRGWEFWLNKLNLFNGNFVDAEMVKSFISSIEYRQRFGP
ncbi:MAG: FG-GAP-like repeat-containing protein [Pyrinomonadaceae bacterium]